MWNKLYMLQVDQKYIQNSLFSIHYCCFFSAKSERILFTWHELWTSSCISTDTVWPGNVPALQLEVRAA